MKTRIVYPQMWLDEKFAACNVATKLLFCYLINNNQLALSPYLHITDRQMMFDTGLNAIQLKKAKDELTNIKWCFFTDNWVFHNHKCAYVDYTRNSQVQKAKETEIKQIPDSVRMAFKQHLNINPKPETRNKKLEIKKEESVRETKAIVSHVSENDFTQIAQKYKVPISFVKSKYDDMVLWAEQKPNNPKLRGRNWKMTLANWVKRDAIELIQKERRGNKFYDAEEELHHNDERQDQNHNQPGGVPSFEKSITGG